MRVATTISATLVAQWPQNYAVGAPRRLDFHSISDDSVPLSNISPHPHPVLHLPRLSQIDASCIRIRCSIFVPNAFLTRKPISLVSEAFPFSKLESACRTDAEDFRRI